MSSEKRGGGQNLNIDLTNHVFENEINKFTKNRGGGPPSCPLGSYGPAMNPLKSLKTLNQI